MRLTWFPLTLAGLFGTACAETFDVYTFTTPAGMQKDSGSSSLRYSRISGSAFCLFELYGAAPASGDVNQALQADWQNLVAKRFNTDTKPETQIGTAKNGWKNAVSGASFPYQGNNSVALLSTFAAGSQVASVLMVGNEKACLSDFETLLKGLTLGQPSAMPASPKTGSTAGNTQAIKTRYAFNTTNFDDGWISVEQKDWVLSRKGNVTVYLHYPNDVTSKYYSNSDENLSVVWNNLVAPRYSNVQGYKQDYNTMNYERPLLAAGYATSKELGKQVYVVLFSQGKSGWVEIVTPSKDVFLQTFGVDIEQVGNYTGSKPYDKLRNLRGLNRFAVAASDLTGKWSSSSSAMTQYVNVYTGLSAGATASSIAESFQFSQNGAYTWNWAGGSGPVGAMTFTTLKSSGKLSMKGNWQINFSDINKKPRLYNAYFEVGKGGNRLLWLQDTTYGDYTAFVQTK